MTLKVMLVDDELLVRLGIRALIDWERHGFAFLGDAADGAKALELMEQEAPDILLTDIVMPRMGGLELIEEVRRRYPDTLIIVLSSHNEFDYVRKAMKLGVEDYILKTSLKPDELLGLLVEASGKIAQRRKPDPSEAHPVEAAASPGERLATAIGKWLRSGAPLEGPPVPGEAEGGSLEEPAALPPNSCLLLLAPHQLREGVSKASALQMLVHLFQSELGGALACRPLETDQREIVLLLSDPLTPPNADALADQLLRSSNRLLGIELSYGASGPLREWRELGRAFAEAREALAHQRVKETSRDDIKRLLAYMQDHFTEELSLKQAAEMINMSESYLSFLFKKETGTGFTDCLNTLRVDKAAYLLTHTAMPIYEISLQVGYENINYFGRLFKKIKGMSPQKYRNQFK
ncbi:hypothetical protein J31TS4_34470 [Paenibacillus sp. J31TS4]|uniref:response regulator n=1 Tax=Paenibacillus sp. J31TS4 TaxID=2807195 RepID=UPI001B17E07F|nr:response regulator [Paenibacillus sp. J31TS4]GIP40167.1 hypothetical protein J31TS4_34470 [Paenibacillus sp. J31TS4]